MTILRKRNVLAGIITLIIGISASTVIWGVPRFLKRSVSVKSQVTAYVLDDRGNINGLLLASGDQLHFGAETGVAVASRIKVGDEVSATGHAGTQTSYGREVRVEQLSSNGQTIVVVPAGPPRPGEGKPGPHGPRNHGEPGPQITSPVQTEQGTPTNESSAATAPTQEVFKATGTVSTHLVNGHGNVDGLILSTGEQVRFSPKVGQLIIAAEQAGNSQLSVEGTGIRNERGVVIRPTSISAGSQTITLIADHSTANTMISTIRRMSLRTRLALLAGFAVVSLLVALFVAWQLARSTETFALRQADSAVRAAARDLAQELQRNPDGYTNMDQAIPAPPDPHKPPPRAPRHIEKLFASYSDPLSRLSAITLHRYPDVEGGFYRQQDRALVGYAVLKDTTTRPSSDQSEIIQQACKEATKTGTPASRIDRVGDYNLITSAYPTQDDKTQAAWAVQRLPYQPTISGWPNVIALVALGLSIIAVSGLALITVRDVSSGVTGIESGLANLTTNLDQQIESPETAELARIARAINELAANLQANIKRQLELQRELRHSERLTALGRVVAGVAHEVRNPLSAIKLKVQLAQRSSYDGEKLNETFDVVRQEIERLDSLVRRLLDLGSQQKFEQVTFDLAELVRSRCAFFNDLALRAGVSLETKDLPASIVIEGDPNRISQVVDNLIQNAFDAMAQGGKLTISGSIVHSHNSDGSASLTFADTGQGIADVDQDHIFEPFHTGRADGTGLGLAIARAIVEEHDGHIGFVSRDGNGTSFVIALPLKSKTQG